MRPGRVLKHLLISIVVGVGVPLVYIIVSRIASTYIDDRYIQYLLWLPIGWPRNLYYYLLFTFSPDSLGNISEVGLAIFQISCNTVPYIALTFVVLSYRSSRKPVQESPTPPLPPQL